MSGTLMGRRLRIAALALAFVLCGRLAAAAILAQSAVPPRESARTRSDGDVEHVYHAGESFKEDAGQAHLVSANASDSVPVTFLAYFVCDGDGPRTVALTKEVPR